MANPGPATNVMPVYVGGGAPAEIGNTSQSLIGAYGSAGVVQPSGNAQVALTRGVTFASVATYATSQSPIGVISNATVEATITVLGTTASYVIGTNDLVILNKPTAQAGFGIGNVRVSASNAVAFTEINISGATITPTAGQKYGIVSMRGLPFLTPTLTPALVPASTTSEQQFTVTGLRTGELVHVSKPTTQVNLDIVGMRVVSNNVVGITYLNTGTVALTPTAEVYTIYSLGGLDCSANNVLIEANVGVILTVATTTTAEQSVTVTGLNVTDTVVGLSKPTAQAGLGIVGWRVAAANSLGITYLNVTGAAITPTSSEVYGVQIFRANPAAPMNLFSVSLTPAVVASATTAEQGFTVTGLVASTMVWVNKPSFQAGLGIAGVRVSGTNNLAVNYCNVTSQSITPAAETYLVASYNQAIPDNGNAFVFGVSPQMQAATILANAIRAAQVNQNWIAGA